LAKHGGHEEADEESDDGELDDLHCLLVMVEALLAVVVAADVVVVDDPLAQAPELLASRPGFGGRCSGQPVGAASLPFPRP
jgi:hypothetical protein